MEIDRGKVFVDVGSPDVRAPSTDTQMSSCRSCKGGGSDRRAAEGRGEGRGKGKEALPTAIDLTNSVDESEAREGQGQGW
eukprot:2960850-Rhodomonas_salina.1